MVVMVLVTQPKNLKIWLAMIMDSDEKVRGAKNMGKQGRNFE